MMMPPSNSGPSSELASPYIRIQNDLETLVDDGEGDRSVTEPKRMPVVTLPSSISSAVSGATAVFSRPAAQRNSAEAGGTSQSGGSAAPSRSLWIGNVDPCVTEDELRAVFGPFGAIESVRLLPGRECAFVNYTGIDAALAAKERLQGAVLGAAVVRIGFGRLPDESARGAASSGDGAATQSRSVWVGNVGAGMTAEVLAAAFAPYGTIESVRVLDAKNCAFVNYTRPEDADAARRAMNGAFVGASVVKTGFAKSSVGHAAAGYASSGYVGARGADECAAHYTSAPAGAAAVFGRAPQLEPPASPVLSTTEVGAAEFRMALPIVPPEAQRLPPELSGSAVRDARRRIEAYGAVMGPDEVEAHVAAVAPCTVAVSMDPVGNILMQRLLERGGPRVPDAMLAGLGPYVAAVGVHKHGTWAVQRLIKHSVTPAQRSAVVRALRPHVVPLMQDQFGNYVVQCCLPFGPAHNQFVLDALYHRCTEVATSRFGSRAMRSVLESPHVSRRQRDFVAMAVIAHGAVLARDPNGVIAVQWLLDSALPGRHACLAPVLAGSYAALAVSKAASSVVARMLAPGVDAAVRDAVVAEVLAPEAVALLLDDPLGASIVHRALSGAGLPPADRVRYAHAVQNVLRSARFCDRRDPHIVALRDDCEAALGVVDLEHSDTAESADDALSRVLHGRPCPRYAPSAVGAPIARRLQ